MLQSILSVEDELITTIGHNNQFIIVFSVTDAIFWYITHYIYYPKYFLLEVE
ncbi:TPA: hypothetical protein RJ119_005155 [Bacillus cereus]|nr:hypothetical protein [Bacillus cereus]